VIAWSPSNPVVPLIRVDALRLIGLQLETSSAPGWRMRKQVDKHIANGQHASLAKALDGAAIKEYRYAARTLHAALRDRDGELMNYVVTSSSKPDKSTRLLTCELLPFAYGRDQARSLSILEALVEDEDWSIRDAASETCGRIFRSNFSPMLGVLEMWRASKSANVRRAVVLASMRAASPRHLERAEPLLKLLEPLLEDREPLVRRNLGPSALGTVLLQHYPSAAFEYLVKWSTSNDPQVLWNVAMAFSCKPAATIAKKALIVLRKLSLDERRFVWRAVASAMWKLGRKAPELIRPELARWLEDERRVNVAREALKHL